MEAGGPRLKGSYRVANEGSVDEATAHLFTSAAALLDGTKSWGQVWGTLLVSGFDPQAIGAVLARLQPLCEVDQVKDDESQLDSVTVRQMMLLAHLYVQEGRDSNTENQIAIGGALQAQLSVAEVVIFATNSELAAELQRFFSKVGIKKTQAITIAGNVQQIVHNTAAQLPPTDSALLVCATDCNDRSLAEVVNRVAVSCSKPAIYYHAQGLQVQVGPLVIPRQTACFECFKVRRESTLAPWERTLLKNADDGGMLGAPLGLDWVTLDAIKLLTALGEPVSRGRVLFIDYHSGLPEVHFVLRLPRCTVCGAPRRPPVRLWTEHQ